MANSRAALTRLAPWLLGGFGLVMLLLVGRSFAGSSGFGYDFDAYYAAAGRLVSGQPLYPAGLAEAYNSGTYAGLYLYPPPLAVLLTPFATLAQDVATNLWLWARIAALAGAIAILPVSGLARGATLAVTALSFPVWYDLNLGNISVLLVALSAVIWRFRDRPIGSVALAVAGAIRYPFGLVALPWAMARRWKPFAWTIIAGVVLFAATLPGGGAQRWLDYLRTITSLGNVSAGEHNLSFATTAHALGIQGADTVFVALGILIGLAATAWAATRRDHETATVVALTATILTFPFFHPHYLAQLAIPAAFLAGRGQWWGLVLPLLGWLPGEWMAPAAALAAIAPLTSPSFLSVSRDVTIGAEPPGAAAEFAPGPTRP
jgi:Glycosyltransferase family 87